MSNSLVRLLLLIVPLGLDTFAVSAALGLSGMSRHDRLRVSALFTAFEAGMPLVGLLVGFALTTIIGSLAEWMAIAVLILLGLYMLVSRDDEKSQVAGLRRGGTRAIGMLALAMSISFDELAVGFTLGLLKVPVVLAVVLIGVQAFVVSQLGFRMGNRIGERLRENAERIAGAVLILLGAALLLTRILRVSV